MDRFKEWTIPEITHVADSYERFFGHMGISTVLEHEDGSVTVPMKVTHALVNSHGTCQGGAIYALCDIACGMYVRIKMSDVVTLNGSIHYYAPGKEGSILTARVTPRKTGETIVTLFCEVTDEDGMRIADSIQDLFRLKRS